MRRRAQYQRLGIGNQRAEVGQRADPQKNQQREDPGRHADRIEVAENPLGAADVGHGNVAQDRAEPDRDQQQRLEPSGNAEIDEAPADQYHGDRPDPAEVRKTGRFPEPQE